jgi:Domain of unknown function (DUF4160)
MPTILKYFGFTLFFYSHDHFPVHVHVEHGEFESIFELIFAEGKLIEIKHRKSAGIEPLPSKLMKEAIKVIELECNFISESWFNYFVKNITPETKKITKKI